MHKNIACIILAAGKGKRMKSDIPKVLHPVCGRPMLSYVLDLVKEVKINNVVLVLGHKHQEIKKVLKPKVKIVIQKKLLGTADAVKSALSALKGFKGTVLVLYADNALLKKETIKKLIQYHCENNLAATLLTAKPEKPSGYGRILRDRYSTISGIVEEKDASDFQKEIKEINTGIIVFEKNKLIEALRYIKPNNRKKEYYLTDAVGILYRKDYLIDAVVLNEANEALGVNSRLDLAKVNRIMQGRINDVLMKKGVGVVDPESTFISYGAEIGSDTTIYPFTVIESDVKIGKRCSVGPFAHLRNGTVLKDEVVAGNFLETVRAQIEAKAWIKHFAYLGDARIGSAANIGAGVVTANFDGKNKNLTDIGDNSFIGSDSILVAPVKIGKNAVTGAGCVVLKNVSPETAVVGVPARCIKKLKR